MSLRRSSRRSSGDSAAGHGRKFVVGDGMEVSPRQPFRDPFALAVVKTNGLDDAKFRGAVGYGMAVCDSTRASISKMH